MNPELEKRKMKFGRPALPFLLGGVCLLFLFLLLADLNAQHPTSDWSLVPLATRPADIFFLRTQGGWILESDGAHQFLFRTSDEGKNWSRIPMTVALQEMFFLDSQHGWSTEFQGDHNSVLVTSDGGTNWSVSCPRLPGGELMVTDILFTDLSHGWIIATRHGGVSTVLETVDGGKTFIPSESLKGKFEVSRVIFAAPNSGHLWTAGENSVLHSSDQGQKWIPQLSRANLPGRRKAIGFLRGRAFEDGRVILVGQSAGAVIFKSNNFGADWKLAGESDEANWFDDVQFWDDRHGCAVGGSTLLFCTRDGGDTWDARNVLPKSQSPSTSVDNAFKKVFFAEGGLRGWVLTGGGFAFETEDGGNSWRRVDLIDTLVGK